LNVFFSNDDLVDLTEKGNLTLQLPKTQNGSIVLPVSIQSSRSLIDPSLFGSLMRFDGSGKEMFFLPFQPPGPANSVMGTSWFMILKRSSQDAPISLLKSRHNHPRKKKDDYTYEIRHLKSIVFQICFFFGFNGDLTLTNGR